MATCRTVRDSPSSELLLVLTELVSLASRPETPEVPNETRVLLARDKFHFG